MDKIRPNLWKIEKDIRHLKNLAGYTGYWHGIFFWLGVCKPNKNKVKKTLQKFKT